MKKKIFGVLLAGAMCLPLGLGLGGCCEQSEQNQGVKDIYAMSALSSVMYLNDETSLSGQNATARPDCFTESEVKSVRDYFEMFNGMLIGDGLKQDVRKTTAEDETYAEKYSYCMTITLPNLDGQKVEYKMYYDEFDLETEEEIEDGEHEVEVSSKIDGVMLFDGKEFVVHGEREFEKEGRETESSIEFITYAVGSREDYVMVEQSVENTEFEYEYTIYRGGDKVSEVEVEMEKERNHTEFEIEFKNSATAGVYKMYKQDGKDEFVIEFNTQDVNEKIYAPINEDGTVTFRYSNGFEETF